MQVKLRRRSTKRGAAMVTSFVLLSLLAVGGTAYLSASTDAVRTSRRHVADVQTTNLCEAGVQDILRSLWKPFKQTQKFSDMDTALNGASAANPAWARSGTLSGVGRYSVGVVGFSQPAGDPYARDVTVRSVGWQDSDNDGVMDDTEASKTIEVTARFELERSQVFDYTYFINNYGWMTGFNQNDLIVNGDMRANGNFDFSNGSPTVNGSVLAAVNDKLVPRAVGLLNSAPVKLDQASYANFISPAPGKLSGESNAAYALRVAAYREMVNQRRRQGYSSASHGADGSEAFETNRDFIFRSDGSLINGRTAGAVIGDSQGVRSWNRTNVGQQAQTVVLDTNSTKEVVMPDLDQLDRYTQLSSTYVDDKATFLDGTPNPHYGQGAWVEVWNSTTNQYQRLSTNGVINGSAVLVGTSDKPIRIHGPVTVSQDVVIKGTVEGQGTLYTGRNVHIVGSIRYKSGPDFRNGVNGVDAANEKKDFLGLAARGSILMGNPKTYGNPYPLAYMTPVNPPSKTVGTYGRYDEAGNWIPPYDANQTDATGKKRYESVVSQSTIDNIAEGVNQIDAVLYSNFVGGGNVGTSGGGLVLNGTIIARDEAIVTWSLPIVMNYDNRIRERRVDNRPLIDLQLPRSPVMLRATWQDKGFIFAGSYSGNNGGPGPSDGENDGNNGHGNDDDGHDEREH